MRVVICGAGHVGYNVAAYLSRDANDITIVDTDHNLIKAATSELDINGVVGHPSSPEVLAKAGLADADIIVAAGPDDDVNMVACQVAHSLFDTPKKIARIRNQDYLDPAWNNLFSRDHMPIDMVISPEIEVAKAIYDRLVVTGATEAVPVCNTDLYFVGAVCREDCPILYTQMKQLRSLFPNFFINIISILRDNEIIQIDKNSQIIENDEIFFIVEPKNLSNIMSYLGVDHEDSKSIVIAGGGRVGASLAMLVEEFMPAVDVKIIEESSQRSDYLAQETKGSLVINGDVLSTTILKEAEVHNSDILIAVTNEDETNALCALQAKHLGCKRTISLVKRSSYTQLLLSTNIDTVLVPQDVTVSRILHHVKRGRVKAVHKLRGGQAEIIEAITSDTCKIINQPIGDLHMPHGIKIASIKRDGEFIFPDPGTVIKSGDFIVIYAQEGYSSRVDSFFSTDMDLF